MHVNRETLLRITDMAGDCADVVAQPHPHEEGIITIEQGDDDDLIWMDRDGARALGEFLVEWATPKQDVPVAATEQPRSRKSPADPLPPFVGDIYCSYCVMPVAAAEAMACRKRTCPAKSINQ